MYCMVTVKTAFFDSVTSVLYQVPTKLCVSNWEDVFSSSDWSVSSSGTSIMVAPFISDCDVVLSSYVSSRLFDLLLLMDMETIRVMTAIAVTPIPMNIEIGSFSSASFVLLEALFRGLS